MYQVREAQYKLCKYFKSFVQCWIYSISFLFIYIIDICYFHETRTIIISESIYSENFLLILCIFIYSVKLNLFIAYLSILNI